MKRNYGRIQVDGFSIESAKGKGGWVDIVTAETKGVSNAFALDMDRQSMGRGTGKLALVSSIDTVNVTVTAAGGIAGDTLASKWFRVGMVCDILDATDAGATKLVDGVTVSSIADPVVVFSATCAAAAATDYICREDVFSTTADNIGEMMGLDGIISDDNTPGSADFEGIAVSAVPAWTAHEDATAQVLSETVIQKELDAIECRTDGDTPNIAITTYDLRNKLIDIIRADRQITTMDLKAGWTGIKYTGGSVNLPIMVHRFCPVGYMYFVSLPHIYFFTLKGFTWDDKGGGVVKPVAGYDAYEAWFKIYGNLGTDCRNAHGKLMGLTTS